jgi:hypothetical protein
MRMEIGKDIQGTIMNKLTLAPIEHAQVMWQDQPTTTVETDSNGAFELHRQQVKLWMPLLPVDTFGYYQYPMWIQAKGFKPQLYDPPPTLKPDPITIQLMPIR